MKPILFNTQMVKAILDGKKTVTRRCIKFPSYVKQQENGLYTLYADGTCYENQHLEDILIYLRQPYKVGDVLYVRETYCWCPCWDCGMDTEEHNCCDKTAKKIFNHDKKEYGCYGYKASFKENEEPSVDTWHPSIHMPKEAARIFLKVTDIKVERLQTITDVGAEKEGATPDNPFDFVSDKWPNKENFKIIWDSTIKKSDIGTYGWNANPWVWVIEFERCSEPL